MLKKTFCINQYAGSSCICVLKMNYDGAVFKDSNEAGLGVVIQYDKGEVMATSAEKISYLHRWNYWNLWPLEGQSSSP